MASEPLLLTADDLHRLTGTKQAKRQCAWLQKHGWVHYPPARKGDIPKVSRSYHDARMSGTNPATGSNSSRPRAKLDWMTGTQP